MSISNVVAQLVDYALRSALIAPSDRVYATNLLIDELGGFDYTAGEIPPAPPLSEILDSLCDYAAERGIIKENSGMYRDLFDTRLMGRLTPPPSEVIRRFDEAYRCSPRAATEYFYTLCKNSNYIREDRIAKDIKWVTHTEFGDLDVTVNLAKPEKDPRAIAAAKELDAVGYPQCPLCPENEGLWGNIQKPARQNLRMIPITLGGERWFFQYSPYVYYNEHCIALSAEHVPMKIDPQSFRKLIGFVRAFPHYFIGQNADLPIVGGSILTHDHMQGGRYTFAMERAPIRERVVFRGFESVEAGIVDWPMSVIRLCSADTESLLSLADKILFAWRSYTDEAAFVFASTKGEPHNTITPIARRRGELYELDLVLRNNITTDEHPLGVYHPHAEHHNIKKENIGLIEVMGLAVLPARLEKELGRLAEAIVTGECVREIPLIEKHAEWLDTFKNNYTFTRENVMDILKSEVGKTFVKVLEDAGVYKNTEEGRAAFWRFIESVNA